MIYVFTATTWYKPHLPGLYITGTKKADCDSAVLLYDVFYFQVYLLFHGLAYVKSITLLYIYIPQRDINADLSWFI